MADNSPSLIPFLGAMTAGQTNETNPDDGPMAPYPRIEDLQHQEPYPPQSYHTRNISRSVYIDFSGWTQNSLQISEGGPGGVSIYTVDLTARNPQMKFFVAGDPRIPFATVTLGAFNTNVQVSIHNHSITINVKSRLKKEGVFQSPSLGNAPLTWKSRSMKQFDFELRDGNGIPLAQFNPHPSWALRKAGRLDLFGPSVSSGQLMEEIMVTAFALVHSTNIQLEAATCGAGASSPGSVSSVSPT
ncbi:uncharacterized protein BJX67DRAFT_383453 [Aspergillus lucknowensis]|uniref:Uncharacterized protein n=1 Tax=Aspergillus lucknowensis TaxID=176173 RepID=A0ABR4LK03_9EURO